MNALSRKLRAMLPILVLASMLSACSAQPDAGGSAMRSVRAPELEPNRGWLNTDRPLRFSDELKGRVVLLDFWTYCCINCMHVLPDLAYLEKKYADEPFQVIGVHSAKFENEASRETIRAAVERYEIEHPVVVDDEMSLWERFGARGWPTFILIDSTGCVAAMESGEGLREDLDRAVASLLKEGREKGTLADGPLKINRQASLAETRELAFPGKVLADAAGRRLFVSDSNHNRIVVSTLPDASGSARLLHVIGQGSVGANDGDFRTARFNRPQGMALAGEVLYVADTENHLIRKIDLARQTVETIAGSGKQEYDRSGGRKGTRQGLNSPWDLELEGDTLYIAMAGPHQLWKMDLKTRVVERYAGSGVESIRDGSLGDAALAQPSGLELLGGDLYFADSETSAIRVVHRAAGKVETLVGQGLFDFGDTDGRGLVARLQHPLGVASWKGNLLIADTYNHKIKRIDPKTREVVTLYGLGKPAARGPQGQLGLFEPGGLDVAGDRLYVADTNNHRVVAIDLAGGAWHEVKIDGLAAPVREGHREMPAGPVVMATAPASGPVRFVLDADLPVGAHPNAEAPMLIKISHGDEVLLRETRRTDSLPVEVELPAERLPDGVAFEVVWDLAWCEEGETGQCIPQRYAWQVQLARADDAPREIRLSP